MLSANVKRLRLGLAVINTNDARSLARQLGPFNAMARQDPRLEIVLPSHNPTGPGVFFDWDFFSRCDIVFFLDPISSEGLSHVQLARACGAKVWVDYIDDVFQVRRSNPNWMHFANREQTREIVSEIIAIADITTTTTQTLRERLPNNERVAVVPESCRWPASPAPRRKVITWRGMSSHDEDASSIAEQLAEVARLPQFSKWEYHFFGDVPWRLADAIPPKQLVIAPVAPPYQFMRIWMQSAPFIHMIPLPDNPFNRAKSCLGWLEASAVGAAVIGPTLPEWRHCDGLIRYDGLGNPSFGTALRRTMEAWDNGKVHPAVIESRADIYPSRTLEAVNELRWIILRKLCGEPPRATAPAAPPNGEQAQKPYPVLEAK